MGSVWIFVFLGMGFDASVFKQIQDFLTSSLIGLDVHFNYISPICIADEAMQKDSISLINGCGERRILIGWSSGAMCLLKMACQDPGILENCILLSPTMRMIESVGYVGYKASVFDKMISMVSSDFANFACQFVDNTFYGSGIKLDVEDKKINHLDAEEVAKILSAMMNFDVRSDLEKLHNYVLPMESLFLFASKNDRVVPVCQSRIVAKNFPSASFVELDSGGHILPISAFLQIKSVISGFLSKMVRY